MDDATSTRDVPRNRDHDETRTGAVFKQWIDCGPQDSFAMVFDQGSIYRTIVVLMRIDFVDSQNFLVVDTSMADLQRRPINIGLQLKEGNVPFENRFVGTRPSAAK